MYIRFFHCMKSYDTSNKCTNFTFKNGDIELNLGLLPTYKDVFEISIKQQDNFKIFHLNARNITIEYNLSSLIVDIGTNSVYGTTDNWLSDTDSDL